MRDLVIRWIMILLFIAVSILIIKLFLWLLPILIGLFIGYLIYDYFKNKNTKEVEVEKVRSHSKKNKKSNKKVIIIDEENND